MNSLLLGIPFSAIRVYTGSFSFLACWIWINLDIGLMDWPYSGVAFCSNLIKFLAFRFFISAFLLTVLPDLQIRAHSWMTSHTFVSCLFKSYNHKPIIKKRVVRVGSGCKAQIPARPYNILTVFSYSLFFAMLLKINFIFFTCKNVPFFLMELVSL